MKNQILDEPIRDSFINFLDKGETILWQESPRLRTSYFNHMLNDLFAQLLLMTVFSILLTLYFMVLLGPFGGVIVLSVSIMIQHFWVGYKNIQKRKTVYAITQKRIFFSFKNFKKTAIHSLYFSEIKNFQINQNNFDKNSNTVFLSLRYPESIAFTTYNFTTGDQRHIPTLELINDVETVSYLLQKGIKNTNTLL